MVKDRQILIANLAAICGSCLLGASVVATKSAVDEIPAISLAFLRYGQGALILLLLLFVKNQSGFRIDKAALSACAPLGVIMYAVFPVLFNTSVRFTTASRGAVILATMPLWTALLARRFGAERLIPAQMIGILVSITGIIVVFLESGFGVGGSRDIMIGNSLMVLVAVAGGLYGVLAKPVIAQFGPMTVTALAMAIGAGLLFIPALIEGLPSALANASPHALVLTVYLGVFGGALAFWLLTFALSRLSPTQAAVYINLNPLVATLLSAIFLGEALSPTFGLGFLLVLVGLGLMNASTLR